MSYGVSIFYILILIIFKFYRTKKEMLNIKGITEAKAEKIFEAAGKIEQL
jgi:hypothetical protein